MITNINQLDFSKKYTYADYMTWRFEERVELIKGRIFKMSPAPNLNHQRISSIVHGEIYMYLKGKSCQVFPAPFDVRLPIPSKKSKKASTVVQPDITVVCDKRKLDKQGCNGAPDLVVEILSPGNTKREMKDKLEVYEKSGVPEYWLVDPEREYIIIYSLGKKGKYVGSTPFTDEDILKSEILKGFELDLAEIFTQ